MKSGSNLHRAHAALAVAFAFGATLAPADARAATKTSNPYQQVVPRTFEYNTTGVIRAGGGTVRGPNQLSFTGIPSATYVTDSSQPIQLGQFVVTPTAAGNNAAAVTTYDNTPFVIQVHAPQYDKTKSVPVLSSLLPNFGNTLHLKTATINSLLVKGHLDGTVDANGASTVTATVDSTRLGSLKGAPKSTTYNYTFPVRSTDLKLPTSWTMNTTAKALASTSAAPAGTTTTTAGTATAANIGSTAAPAATVAAAVVPAPAAETIAAPAPSISAALARQTPVLLAAPAAEEVTAGSVAPTPTPEPSTFALFGAALAGLTWNRRRTAR